MERNDKAAIEALLKRHSFHFSKSMGQNFLIDPAIPYEIAESSRANEQNGVLEIGPGIGALSHELCERAGKVVAVQNGSYAEELLADDADLTATFADVLGYDDYLTALMDLQAGGCDAVLVDQVVGEYKIAGMGATDLVAAVVLADDNYGVAFRKEDVALKDKVEEILKEMKADGSLAAISEKWFGKDITVVP